MAKSAKRFISLTALLGLIVAAAGCGTSVKPSESAAQVDGKTAPAAKVVKIQYSFWGDSKTKELHEKVITEFMKTHPNIKVEPVYVSAFDQYVQKIQTTMAAGSPPDVINFLNNDLNTFASRGVLADVSDLVKRDWESSKLDDNMKNLMDAMKVDGKYFALPRNASGWYLYYNKNLFDKAGVSYPDSTWTWDKFVQEGKKLTNTSGNSSDRTWAIAINAKSVSNNINFIWQAGGDYFSKDYKSLTIDSPEAKKGLQYVYDLMYKDKIAPDQGSISAQNPKDMFTSGKVAMYEDAGALIASLQDIKNFNWDIALLPQGPAGNRLGRMGPTGLAIPKDSKNKDAAWEFIKFVNGPVGQEILCSSGFSAPVRKSILNDEKKFLPADKFKVNRKVALEGIENNSQVMPSHKNWTQIQTIAEKYLELYYFNSMKLDDATKKIVDEVAPLLK